jgi:hypothetical protein
LRGSLRGRGSGRGAVTRALDVALEDGDDAIEQHVTTTHGESVLLPFLPTTFVLVPATYLAAFSRILIQAKTVLDVARRTSNVSPVLCKERVGEKRCSVLIGERLQLLTSEYERHDCKALVVGK